MNFTNLNKSFENKYTIHESLLEELKLKENNHLAAKKRFLESVDRPLNEREWKFTIPGNFRNAIFDAGDEEDYEGVKASIIDACSYVLEHIDESDFELDDQDYVLEAFEDFIEELDYAEFEDEDEANYYLNELYDLLDNTDIFLGLREGLNEEAEEEEEIDHEETFRQAIIDWFYDHEQAKSDIEEHVGVPVEDISFKGFLAWIAEHGGQLQADFEAFFNYDIDESLNEERKPKYWNSIFAEKAIDAYEKGDLTFDNIEEWDTAYNKGVKPNPPFNTKEILSYYEKYRKRPSDESLNENKRIEYDDDFVKVYVDGKEIYKGIDDYEPMRDEDWRWNDKEQAYFLTGPDGKEYKKICVESLNESQNQYDEKIFDIWWECVDAGPHQDYVINDIIENFIEETGKTYFDDDLDLTISNLTNSEKRALLRKMQEAAKDLLGKSLDESWSGVFSVKKLMQEFDIDKNSAKKLSDYLYDNSYDDGFKYQDDALDFYRDKIETEILPKITGELLSEEKVTGGSMEQKDISLIEPFINFLDELENNYKNCSFTWNFGRRNSDNKMTAGVDVYLSGDFDNEGSEDYWLKKDEEILDKIKDNLPEYGFKFDDSLGYDFNPWKEHAFGNGYHTQIIEDVIEESLTEEYAFRTNDELYNLDKEITDYLNNNNFHGMIDLYAISPNDEPVPSITYHIDGDWKHEHLRFKYLVKQFLNDKNIVFMMTDKEYPSDSDSYEADYTIHLMKRTDESLNESNEEKPNKEQFIAYCIIQHSGITNMFNVDKVIEASDYVLDIPLTEENILYIYSHYSELLDEYHGFNPNMFKSEIYDVRDAYDMSTDDYDESLTEPVWNKRWDFSDIWYNKDNTMCIEKNENGAYVLRKIKNGGDTKTIAGPFSTLDKAKEAAEEIKKKSINEGWDSPRSYAEYYYEHPVSTEELEKIVKKDGHDDDFFKEVLNDLDSIAWFYNEEEESEWIEEPDYFDDYDENESLTEDKRLSPKKENVRRVCDYMDWRTPTFADPTVNGYKVKWGGISLVEREGKEQVEKWIKDIDKHLGIKCSLTRSGNLVIPYYLENESLTEGSGSLTAFMKKSKDFHNAMNNFISTYSTEAGIPTYEVLDMIREYLRSGNFDYSGKDETDKVDECLTEDTVKQDGKWVNKGKEGTHGKFKTKKEADAQRKAMFANGYKEELEEEKEFGDKSIKAQLALPENQAKLNSILQAGTNWRESKQKFMDLIKSLDCTDANKKQALFKISKVNNESGFYSTVGTYLIGDKVIR